MKKLFTGMMRKVSNGADGLVCPIIVLSIIQEAAGGTALGIVE